ncbi:MAG: class I SAM-dependent methyltransferase [Gammaproteobacteria bacterium]|jgi:SAM-dependent methyltransferase|nr:SAM-dependent methyltransferase [Chromatiales bacterium]MDP6413978.1 class I SAM-dependent methyltransferase [Gammaproteobacteria bacterium]MDP6673829.1 class I SAM-dependent methyltransferase [Gammaproteobacteria bacterium]
MRNHDHQDISTWVRQHARRLAPSSELLDLACGKGRHTRYLANLGHRVTAIDLNLSGIRDLTTNNQVELIEHDLENSPWPFTGRHFDGIIVTNYLYRPLFSNLLAALSAGGTLIYDTFAAGNEHLGQPENPAFLLNPGELLEAFASELHVVAYDHGRTDEPRPAIRQRLCGIRIGPESCGPEGE